MCCEDGCYLIVVIALFVVVVIVAVQGCKRVLLMLAFFPVVEIVIVNAWPTSKVSHYEVSNTVAIIMVRHLTHKWV